MTGAERVARHRQNQAAEIVRLRAEVARLEAENADLRARLCPCCMNDAELAAAEAAADPAD
jgi:cell division protein FtsB